YLLLFWVGLVTAGLTGFYTFRAYFLTFEGEERLPPEAGHHAHESPLVMTVPLVILAIGALFAGLAVGSPVSHWLLDFLGKTPSLNVPAVPETHWGLMALSSVVAVTGIVVAWWMYRSEPRLAGRLVARVQGLYQLSLNKFHFDELYDFFIVRPLAGFAEFCRV